MCEFDVTNCIAWVAATWNIYRELDRTTAYLRKSVLRWQKAHQDRRSLREVLWMAVVFRFCNKIETFYDVQGIPKSDEFKAFKKRCVLRYSVALWSVTGSVHIADFCFRTTVCCRW